MLFLERAQQGLGERELPAECVLVHLHELIAQSGLDETHDEDDQQPDDCQKAHKKRVVDAEAHDRFRLLDAGAWARTGDPAYGRPPVPELRTTTV